MTAREAWLRRYREKGLFQPDFLRVANITEETSNSEHLAALKVALAKGRFSLERALIKAALEGNMTKFIMYARDLNTVHALEWKVEQDTKQR